MPHPISPTSIPAVERFTNANSGMSMTTPQPQPFSPPTMFPPFTSATPHSTPDQGTLQSSAVLLLIKASQALAGSCVILSTVFLSLGMVFGAAKPAFAHEKYFKVCNKSNDSRVFAFGARMGSPANTNHPLAFTNYENAQPLIDWNQRGFWYSKGWFHLSPDNCIQVARGHEFGRYVYLHVIDYNHLWTFGDGGKGTFCTTDTYNYGDHLGNPDLAHGRTPTFQMRAFFIAEYDEPINFPSAPFYDGSRYISYEHEFQPFDLSFASSEDCIGLEYTWGDVRRNHKNRQFHRHDIGDSNTSFTWNIDY